MRKRRYIALTLVWALLCLLFVSGAGAAETPVERYMIGGHATEGGYTLTIQAEGIDALTGRLALSFDTEKVRLAKGDSLAAFEMKSGLAAVAEVRPESDMVSNEKGIACVAWYGGGLDARSTPGDVATLEFVFRDGCTAADVDCSTFRLMAVEPGDMGPFRSAASMQGRGKNSPIRYEYMTDERPLGVVFTYEGSDRAPSDGKAVTFQFRNNLGEAVSGSLTLNGSTYSTNGAEEVKLSLAPGEYLWRTDCAGYGEQSGRLTVTGDVTVPLSFVNDETLVRQAAEDLAIGYREGDSAQRVTDTLSLPRRTDAGVAVSWTSDTPGVVTKEGLVYLPDSKGANVTLTATLTHGDATATKDFTVYVWSKAELNLGSGGNSTGSGGSGGGAGTSGGQTAPPQTGTTPGFSDLTNYDWAEDAIIRMAGAGIIKGFPDGSFRPEESIRRCDFVLLLTRMLGVDESEPEAGVASFADVREDAYYYRGIMKARALGIAQGRTEDTFAPEDPITRQEMVVFTVRALEKTGYITLSGAEADLNNYTDAASVAGYAVEGMRRAVTGGLIQGDELSRLNPTRNTGRAEAAVFIARIYDRHTP